MSRIIFIAVAFVISIGASVPTFAQARPAASPTPARPAASQPAPVTTARPAVPQPAPLALPANVPAAKIAVVDTTVFGDEKAGIRRYINAVNTVQRGFDGKNAELRNLQSQIKVIADDLNKLSAGNVVVSGLIFGVDREGQRLDGGEMKLAHLLCAPALLRELRRKRAVGPIGAVPEGRDQQHAGDQPVWQLGQHGFLSATSSAAR